MKNLKMFSVVVVMFLLAIPMLSYAETLPNKCLLTPVNSSCKAMMEKYYFNQKTGQCSVYIYDGCGPVVPFDTLEGCRALCETVSSENSQIEPTETKKNVRERSGLAYDPVENDPRYTEVFHAIDAEVKDFLAADPDIQRRGSVHIYWDTKKNLLKRKYNIDWRSPAEMNPHVIFD